MCCGHTHTHTHNTHTQFVSVRIYNGHAIHLYYRLGGLNPLGKNDMHTQASEHDNPQCGSTWSLCKPLSMTLFFLGRRGTIFCSQSSKRQHSLLVIPNPTLPTCMASLLAQAVRSHGIVGFENVNHIYGEGWLQYRIGCDTITTHTQTHTQPLLVLLLLICF